jgi:hypothetical protein
MPDFKFHFHLNHSFYNSNKQALCRQGVLGFIPRNSTKHFGTAGLRLTNLNYIRLNQTTEANGKALMTYALPLAPLKRDRFS